MNENIDLTNILKDCPDGWELYSTLFGEVKFVKCIGLHLVLVRNEGNYYYFTQNGMFIFEGTVCKECALFPSKEQRDWSKFSAPWYKSEESTISPSEEQRDWSKVASLWRKHEKNETVKKKEKFNPQTLHEFDKVLVRDGVGYKWNADFYSYKLVGRGHSCIDDVYTYCIPYNDDTKHLLGTSGEAPDFYRYWEENKVSII